MDLCSNVFTQAWVAEYLRTGAIYAHIEETRALYRSKRNHMMERLREATCPSGPTSAGRSPRAASSCGYACPPIIDTEKMFLAAIERKVAYVVGSAFYFDAPEHNEMRINFSYASLEQIDEGVKRLSEVIAEEIGRREPTRERAPRRTFVG